MGKRSKKKAPNVLTGSQASISLREESTGKKQTNVNAKTMLKLQHIKNLSIWASGEASIPSLGAFFGHRLAASTEALGIPPDPSLFTCQRCESVLQPGYNCTIRIEKNRSKVRRRRKKPSVSSQNNVVYKCHFCSHRNVIRGTPLSHMKEIRPRTAKASSKSDPANKKVHKSASSERSTLGNVEVNKTAVVDAASAVVPKADIIVQKTKSLATSLVGPGPTFLDGKKNEVNITAVAEADAASAVVAKADPVVPRDDVVPESPETPLVRPGPTLLEAKMRKRNRSGSKKVGESAGGFARVDEEKGVNTSSKRKRKSWTSLKEIVESREHDNGRNFKNLTVPFFL